MPQGAPRGPRFGRDHAIDSLHERDDVVRGDRQTARVDAPADLSGIRLLREPPELVELSGGVDRDPLQTRAKRRGQTHLEVCADVEKNQLRLDRGNSDAVDDPRPLEEPVAEREPVILDGPPTN